MWGRGVSGRRQWARQSSFALLLERKSRRAWKWTFPLYCRQQHQMAGIKYWLSEVYLLETEPVEPVKAA